MKADVQVDVRQKVKMSMWSAASSEPHFASHVERSCAF